MNKILLLLLLIGIVSCQQGTNPYVADAPLTDHEELKKMYEEDQADRKSGNIDWALIAKRDSIRQARVYELLDSGKVRTSLDHANAAMIFQHGNDTIASGMAVKMMRKAIALDASANKWLLAAAIDRDLMRRGKPQIYGTQYIRNNGDELWQIYNLDTTQITDAERIEFGVETLAQQREKLKMMNKKKLATLLSDGKTIDEIARFCEGEQLQDSEYDLSEDGINSFGYQLMAQQQYEEALKIFKLNTELYPDGFNTYDSYGECLLRLGKTTAAVEAYEKSLALNPDNSNAQKVLAELKDK